MTVQASSSPPTSSALPGGQSAKPFTTSGLVFCTFITPLMSSMNTGMALST